MLREKVTSVFRQRFGCQPSLIVRAPGRVNLIGEHTDYNDGFVLPMAIDRAVWIALRPTGDRHVRVYSMDFDHALEFSLEALEHGGAAWGEYVKGVAWALRDHGHDLEGWEGTVTGDIPIGAGLSSSAALEMASARAFAEVSGLPWDPILMARLGQKAENGWVGVKCGIMDQMASAAGRKGHALLIDCRSVTAEAIPLPGGVSVVVMDTASRRGLRDSAYNERRAQCEAAARHFGVPALRDLRSDVLQGGAGGLDAVTLRRARHVVSENERTLRAARAMRGGDAVQLGQLMNASHASLRDDFEVSSRELDCMVEVALSQGGCYGARMTGAGFGGCAIGLVREGTGPAFAEAVARAYQAACGLSPHIYVCQATNGAEVFAPG